jgi:peptidyl-Lys metalloendopeptidase
MGAAFVTLPFLAAVANAQTESNRNGLLVIVSSETANLNGTDDVTINVTMKNVGSVPILVPKWYVPSQAATSGVFTITRDGEPVPYLGALVKRKPASARDMTRIDAGASMELKVELSALYDLSLTGVYNVQYDVRSMQTMRAPALGAATAERQPVDAQSEPQTIDLVSNTISLAVMGDANAEARRAAELAATASANDVVSPAFAASVSFVGCSNTRTQQVRTALSSAETYASNSLGYLNANTRGARYTTWFGTYNSTRYSTARSHFSKISDAASTKPLTFDCSTCPNSSNASAYAYVYANQPYRVYLCNAFWSAPNTGTDSRAGTLIHELSHFTVVAGTNDYVYGQSGARSLATSNPARALLNADNHEYFAENTPPRN